MSIAEFTSALKERAYSNWFKSSQKNILAKPASEYRKEAQQAKSTSFLLTNDTLIQLAEKLSGQTLTQVQVDKLLSDLAGQIDGTKAVLVDEEILGGTKVVTGVYFRQVAFEKGIDSILQKALSSVTFKTITDKNGKERPAVISDYFQKGHVFGVATNVTTQTARNLSKSAVTAEAKNQLLGTLVSVRNKLLRQDLATANIPDIKFSLYSKYLKTPYRYLVEMQIKEENREAGGEAAVYLNAIRRYFDPNQNAASIAKDLRTRTSVGDVFINKLINTRGSPSFIELIAAEVLQALKGKTSKNTKYEIPITKVVSISKKVDTKAIRAANKKSIEKLNKAINIVKALEPEGKAQQPPPQSPVNLLALLRSKIASQVQQNMGTGASTNVLNYRSGRFANSVTIDRLTTSREGTVSVFYNYMRNPYGTFSEGGAQQSPRTRDPKTLISKSIREIGAAAMVSRMRAVLV